MSCCNKNKKIIINGESTTNNTVPLPKSFVKSSRIPAGTLVRTCKTCFTRNTSKECIVCGAPLI
jgi:hypothetical protein